MIALCLVWCSLAAGQPVKVDLEEVRRHAAEKREKIQAANERAAKRCQGEEAPTPAEERQFGRNLARKVVRQQGEFGTSEPMIGYLAVVGRLLASHSKLPAQDWIFGYTEGEGINTFSTAGGWVFVSRGLLAKVTNEAQLAGVLAQEIAEVSSGRDAKLFRKAVHDVCAFNAVTTEYLRDGLDDVLPAEVMPPGGAAASTRAEQLESAEFHAATLLRMKHSTFRGPDEDQAAIDAVAVELLVAAGYDPSEYAAFLKASGARPERLKSVTLAVVSAAGGSKGVKPPLKVKLLPR